MCTFVSVARYRGNALDPEVERLSFVASPLQEGDKEGAEARIDMKRDPLPERDLTQSGDIIDDSVWEAGGRPDDQDGVVVHETADGFQVYFQRHGVDVYVLHFDVEVVASFVERCMGGGGYNPKWNR